MDCQKRAKRFGPIGLSKALIAVIAAYPGVPASAELSGSTAIVDTGSNVYLIGTTRWNELSDWAYNDRIGVKLYGSTPYSTIASYWFDIEPDQVASGYITATLITTRRTGSYTVTGQHRHRFLPGDPWQYFYTPTRSRYVVAYRYLP